MTKDASKKLETGTTSEGEKQEERITYPSVKAAEYEHGGATYLFLCNSSGEGRVTFQATVVNESFLVTDVFAQRGYTHKNDRLYGWLEPLEVRCYRIRVR